MTLDQKIAEHLFLAIPLLHDHLIKPVESTMRYELSPMQFYTLVLLLREGCMNMTELSGYFGIPKQQMTKIINRLVEMGAVVRRDSPTDRRLVQICASEHAKDCVEKHREEVCRVIASALIELSEEDKTRLLEAICTIKSILPKIAIQNK